MNPKQSSILRKIFLYISILCILEIWFISTIAIGHGNDEGSVNNGSISQYSLIGTYTGCIKELRGDGETPFTIVITSDTANKHPIYGTVWHHIGGTVTLSSFPPYIFQTTFSPEIAGQYTGFWREMDFFGLIIAKGEKVSKVTLTFLISPNLNQIKITVGCFKFGAFDRVNDRPNRATHDRRNGAIYKWPKSGYRTSLKLVFFTPFQSDIFS